MVFDYVCTGFLSFPSVALSGPTVENMEEQGAWQTSASEAPPLTKKGRPRKNAANPPNKTTKKGGNPPKKKPLAPKKASSKAVSKKAKENSGEPPADKFRTPVSCSRESLGSSSGGGSSGKKKKVYIRLIPMDDYSQGEVLKAGYNHKLELCIQVIINGVNP